MRKLFSAKGFNLLSTEYLSNKLPLVFEKDGYKYFSSYNAFMKTDNPKKWGKNNPFSIDNLKLYLLKEGAKCQILSTEYSNDKIELKCEECGKDYAVSLSNLIEKKQYTCPECGKKRAGKKNRKDDIYLPILKENEINLLEEYKGAKYHHWGKTKEGYYVRVQPYTLKRNTNVYDFVFDVENKYVMENIKTWLKINGNGLEFLSKEYIGSKERYTFKCSCGREFETSWQYVYLNGITRCPVCSRKFSKFALKVREWLDENSINYITEKVFENCAYIKPLKFDFYLPKFNSVIEVDGQQHFIPVKFGGISKERAEKNYENVKIRDNIKDNFCSKNGIPLLRIPYYLIENDTYKELLTTFIAEI